MESVDVQELSTVSAITVTDSNDTSTLPNEMTFNGDSLVSVITYAILFVISAIGNLTVFIALHRNRKRRSRVNLFIMHLSIADLFVTFVMMPLEIGWHVTVSWKAGDAGCRVFMFCRTFGFYLSSFILIAISLDRYFAISRPLSLNDAGKRGKLMLLLAWLFSVMASIPQSVIFHEETHPKYPWFAQCVTFHFFPSTDHELAYNLFNIFMMYLIPLVVIVLCYSLILLEISRRSKADLGLVDQYSSGSSSPLNSTTRRSGRGRIQRAKMNTLRMTIVIVAVFIICWTPYFVILAWWWFDQVSAGLINKKVQRGLFIFAVSNSCMNPIVYGMFSTVFKRDTFVQFICGFLRCLPRSRPPPTRHNMHPMRAHGQNGMVTNRPALRPIKEEQHRQSALILKRGSNLDLVNHRPRCGTF